MIITLLVFLIILTVLVIIHEAGHYFVAKKLGIKVEEFGFGLPPRAFGIIRGETIYSINWLPIGGFVKLYGEDEAGAGRLMSKNKQITTDLNRAFFSRSAWQRALVIIAGVIMNTFLAIAIFYIYFSFTHFTTEVPLLDNHQFFMVHQQNVNLNDTDVFVSYVSPNSPAERAGILPHARILTLNGVTITDRLTFIQQVNKLKGKLITITWEDIRTLKTYTVQLIPRVSPPKNEGPIGIAFPPTAILQYKTPVEKVLSGVIQPLNMMSYTFDVMGKLIAVSIAKKTAAPVSQGVSGPVGIYSLVNSVLQIPNFTERITQLLNLAGLLSISLAFFNVLPIPGLDGGRLFFILIEAFSGRKINQKIEENINAIGMAFLIILIFVITFKDLVQFHILPFIKP